MDYSGQIDWGDWQKMPDYRQGWTNKHKSGITEIGRALDVTTYIPGLNKVSDFVHDGAGRVMTTANEVLSPLVKAIHKYTVPDYQLNKNNFIGDIHRYTEDKPADALAMAAATYFTAGAASSLAAGSGGAAAGAGTTAATTGAGTLGAAGTAAATQAITPALASIAAPAAAGATGTGALTALGTAALTPAFASGVGGGLVSGAALGAGATGYGGLGVAGTSAANTALTPAFATFGQATSPGWLGTAKDIYKGYSRGKDYVDNLRTMSQSNGQTDEQRSRQQAGAIADRILNAPQKPQTARQKVANQLMINRFRTI